MEGQTLTVEEFLHNFRKDIDACIKTAEGTLNTKNIKGVREMSLVRTKLQEAKMWCGKCLEAEGAPFPEELRDEAKEEQPKLEEREVDDDE